eukprot:gene40640-53745_t
MSRKRAVKPTPPEIKPPVEDKVVPDAIITEVEEVYPAINIIVEDLQPANGMIASVTTLNPTTTTNTITSASAESEDADLLNNNNNIITTNVTGQAATNTTVSNTHHNNTKQTTSTTSTDPHINTRSSVPIILLRGALTWKWRLRRGHARYSTQQLDTIIGNIRNSQDALLLAAGRPYCLTFPGSEALEAYVTGLAYQLAWAIRLNSDNTRPDIITKPLQLLRDIIQRETGGEHWPYDDDENYYYNLDMEPEDHHFEHRLNIKAHSFVTEDCHLSDIATAPKKQLIYLVQWGLDILPEGPAQWMEDSLVEWSYNSTRTEALHGLASHVVALGVGAAQSPRQFVHYKKLLGAARVFLHTVFLDSVHLFALLLPGEFTKPGVKSFVIELLFRCTPFIKTGEFAYHTWSTP